MKRFLSLALFAFALLPVASHAHGPSRQKVVREVSVNAPPEKVWAIIADFCSISSWNPEVTACVAEAGNRPETGRVITLASGKQLKEKLVKHDPAAMSMQIMLVEPNPEAMPINTLGSTISVRAGDAGASIIEWRAAFYRSFPGPTPPPELSDEAAVAAVEKLVDAGLAKVKELAEK